jgi:hypothetical protein
VIKCVPTVNVGAVNGPVGTLVAVPFTTFTGLEKFTPSIRNWTVPVLTVEVDVMLAVNVTACPRTEGLSEELTEVVVLAPAVAVFTVWVRAALVELLKLLLGSMKLAVIVCVPALNELIAPLGAVPAVRGMGRPKFVPSITNCTIPFTMTPLMLVAITVAVIVTGWPSPEGFVDELTEVIVLTAVTVWVMADEVGLGAKVVSPLV